LLLFYTIRERIFESLSTTYLPPVLLYAVDKTEMNITQAKVLELIRDNPDITQPQLAVKLGLGKTAIQNSIATESSRKIME